MSETPQRTETWQTHLEPAICGFLLLAVAFVFGQTVHHDFVDFDDNDYVYQNPYVLRGLTTEGIVWASTATHSNNWHPFTWLSHMLDCQLYGRRPGGHHLTSVLLHAANAVLLFLVLRRMTGDLWPSAFVAAVFALHPLRVESVAWVAERKDVLSGLFFMLTLWAYLTYVRQPFSWARYLTVVLLFAAGVMAKPMLVTVPFVLLLLDYWPLGRLAGWGGSCTAAPGATVQLSPQRSGFPWRLVVEKLPLLAVAAVSCVATTMAQNEIPLDVVVFSRRFSNALVSYVAYIGQLFYPAGLSAFYPYPGPLAPWKVWGAILVLLAVSLAAAVRWRRNPYLPVGWLWYLGMLVPVIGFVQVGRQAMADRYTYLPQIGLCVAIAWGAAEVVRSQPILRWVCGAAMALVVVALTGCAWQQTTYWRNNETLWNHALDCDPANVLAHNNLAAALTADRKFDKAIAEYRAVLKVKPYNLDANHNLANLLAQEGRLDEAEEHYRQALKIVPNSAATHNNLANLLARQGRLDEAVEHYGEALKVRPDYGEAHYNLANRLVQLGRLDEAARHYRQALKLLPNRDNRVEAIVALGNVLARQGQLDEAVEYYHQALTLRPNHANARNNLRKVSAEQARLAERLEQCRQALESKPDDVAAANNLAWLLATCPSAALRNGAEAIEIAGRASRLAGGDQPAVLDTLAAAYAEAGRFPEAIATARQALDLAVRQNKQSMADGLRARLALYEAGKPCRPASPASSAPYPKP